MYPPSTAETWRADLVEWGPRILIALAILVATWIIARAVKWALAKAISKTPALQKHTPGNQHETVGHQIGTIAKLVVWLVGIMAALNFLQIGQILSPVATLTNQIFEFLPRLIGAGLIFFVGLIVARIVRRLVETLLTAANIDGLMARAGLGDHPPTVRTDPDAVPPGTTPGATRTSLARAAGVLAFALIIIPVAIAALQVLGIEAISGPAIHMLDQISGAIPRLLTAALWLGIAFIAAKFLKTIIEAILPPTGFDDALRSTGVLPATTTPSRIVANVAFVAIMLAAAIEAAHQLGGDTVAIFLVQVTSLGSKVIFGTLIIVAGIFLAKILANLVGSSTGEGGFAQTIVRYAIIALFTAIGLTFMGLADVIVYMAFGLILGSAAIATALAFGLGGREAAGRILNHFADRVTGAGDTPRTPRRPARLEGTKETPTGDGPTLI
ncbi:mechanosensitive ion channel [Sphingomonas sp. LHG3406-1]|uniref:mechanosensitive ion channel n=1 Tax=Sphingomonas sp. LHG3406-1 TaxID=2804617 RepID=UPI0026307D5E|nr:mechanosensitive ion channel [Sphingomonas sp. LHG3406-1]